MHAVKRLFILGRLLCVLFLAVAVFIAIALAASRIDTDPGAMPTDSTASGTAGAPGTSGTSSPSLPGQTVLPDVGATVPQKAMTKADLLRLSAQVDFDPAALYTADALAEAGLALSTETYGGTSTLLARVTGLTLPTVYSSSYEEQSIVHYVRPSENAAPEPVYEIISRPRPAVDPYMGQLMITEGDSLLVCDTAGVALYSGEIGDILPLNTRDKAGNPLYFAPEAMGWQVFFLTEEGMALADYDDTVDNRGLYFDYAPAFGISDNNLLRLVERTVTLEEALDGTSTETVSHLWAYGFSTAWRRTGYNYTAAYDFSEGLAAILDADGHLNYIGEYGYYAFYTRKNYYYYDRYVTEYLLPPLTDGEESIGFYYYDHGLVRVRRQIVDWYGLTVGLTRVAVDEDILIDKTGKEFPIPEGYDIVSYSDGVILLERDGKYGYMDYTGRWIAQPIYDYARPFFEGLAVVGFADGTRLMLDTEGEIVIPAGVYSHISDVSSGVIAAYSETEGWHVLQKMARFAD